MALDEGQRRRPAPEGEPDAPGRRRPSRPSTRRGARSIGSLTSFAAAPNTAAITGPRHGDQPNANAAPAIGAVNIPNRSLIANRNSGYSLGVREQLGAGEVERHHEDDEAGDPGQRLLVAERRLPERGDGEAEEHEHHGEAEREQAGHRGDPDQVPVLAALELADREPRDQAQVARDHREDTGREDRHDPAPERHEDGDVGGGDLAENHQARLRPRPRRLPSGPDTGTRRIGPGVRVPPQGYGANRRLPRGQESSARWRNDESQPPLRTSVSASARTTTPVTSTPGSRRRSSRRRRSQSEDHRRRSTNLLQERDPTCSKRSRRRTPSRSSSPRRRTSRARSTRRRSAPGDIPATYFEYLEHARGRLRRMRAGARAGRADRGQRREPRAGDRTAHSRPTSSASCRTTSASFSGARSSGRRRTARVGPARGARSRARPTRCCGISPSGSSWRARAASTGRSADASARTEERPSSVSIFKDEFMEATTDLWDIPPEQANRVGHPAPFPIELPQRLIDLYTYEERSRPRPVHGFGNHRRRRRANRASLRRATTPTPGYVDLANARITAERERLEALQPVWGNHADRRSRPCATSPTPMPSSASRRER